jgi:hypothetical protein
MKALDWNTLLRLVELGVKTRLEVDDAQLALIQPRGGLARAQSDDHVARVYLELLAKLVDSGTPWRSLAG